MSETWTGVPSTNVDDSIMIVEFGIKRKLKVIKQVEAKIEISENEKIKIGQEYDFIRHVRKLIEAFRKSHRANLGKIPPAAVDLEETILGALMVESIPSQYTEEHFAREVLKFLKPEHFYNSAHQLIYQAIIDLNQAGQPFDMRMVVNQLRKNGTIEIIGGAHYIAELTSKVSSSASVVYHARVTVEFAIKRSLIMMCSGILLDAYEDTSDCFALLDNAEKTIKQIAEWRKK